MSTVQARFSIGQVLIHNLFGYRGVVIDVDSSYRGSEQWYEKNAPGSPEKNRPWYYILVHDSVHHAYAAEDQLIADSSGYPVEHPEVEHFFDGFVSGKYHLRYQVN